MTSEGFFPPRDPTDHPLDVDWRDWSDVEPLGDELQHGVALVVLQAALGQRGQRRDPREERQVHDQEHPCDLRGYIAHGGVGGVGGWLGFPFFLHKNQAFKSQTTNPKPPILNHQLRVTYLNPG